VWDQAKNFATLDAAARDLAWPVTVAGEHTSPDGRKCELSNLRCIGAQPDHAIETLLERTSIFVHPARYEPFGLAVFEAAMHGCALVLSDLPTLRELWEGAAVFADPNDASALRKQLEMLIERADVRESLAQAALRRAERYRPEAMSAAYLAVYRDLFHGPKSAERQVA
jgi:glycosyltransferase involved in cell wall biosynthesis